MFSNNNESAQYIQKRNLANNNQHLVRGEMSIHFYRIIISQYVKCAQEWNFIPVKCQYDSYPGTDFKVIDHRVSWAACRSYNLEMRQWLINESLLFLIYLEGSKSRENISAKSYERMWIGTT